MNRSGEIIVVEDDHDDREILDFIIGNVLRKNGFTNHVKFFSNGFTMLEYLRNLKQQPFIIISDINMPK